MQVAFTILALGLTLWGLGQAMRYVATQGRVQWVAVGEYALAAALLLLALARELHEGVTLDGLRYNALLSDAVVAAIAGMLWTLAYRVDLPRVHDRVPYRVAAWGALSILIIMSVADVLGRVR